MATVIYGKCYLWEAYYGKCSYGKSIYGKSIMTIVTVPWNRGFVRWVGWVSILVYEYTTYCMQYTVHCFPLYAVHCTLRVYLAHNTFPEKGTQSLKENSNYYRLEVKGQNWVE